MFCRFERRTVAGRRHPACAAVAALPRAEPACGLAQILRKALAEMAETRKRGRNQWGADGQSRWRKLAETSGNPQDARYGEPTVPALDLTQSQVTFDGRQPGGTQHHGHRTGAAGLRSGCHLRRHSAHRRRRGSGPFRPPRLRPRRRQGSGGGPGRPARRRRGLPARLRPPPPARRRQGPGVQSLRRRPRLRKPPHHRADRQ